MNSEAVSFQWNDDPPTMVALANGEEIDRTDGTASVAHIEAWKRSVRSDWMAGLYLGVR